MNEVANINENTEDIRGELAESIKQRKRERADLVTLNSLIIMQIDD
jgi:hypothetical protein